jgi:hypothetical protein
MIPGIIEFNVIYIYQNRNINKFFINSNLNLKNFS